MIERHERHVAEIQSEQHSLFLAYRCQNRLIQSETFAEAWYCASDSERKFILAAIGDPDPEELRRWIIRMLQDGLEKYPFSILRQLASHHKIKNYSRMSREQLLSALTTKGITDGSTNIRRDA